ncbi:MAG: RDD family protein [Candidatus Acidiferrales bacterium]
MFCSRCGAATPEGAVFCGTCGQPLNSVSPVVAPGYALPVAPVAAMYRPLYAGFWLRVVAYFIDALIIGIPFGVIILVLLAGTGVMAGIQNIHPGDSPDAIFALLGVGAIFGAIILALVGSWLYYAWCESSAWQATFGKKALGLYVTNMQGQRITFGRASGRFFAKIITGMILLGIGYMLAGFTEKKQALHDMIASCLVMRKS